jgi:hypothetical protein
VGVGSESGIGEATKVQNLKRSQRGASMAGILVGLVVLGFLATIAIKLGPHYLTFMTVRSVMDEVQEDPASAGASPKSVLDTVDKKLYINGVTTVSRNDFKYSRQKGGNELTVDYEVREPLMANFDALLTFSYKVPLGQK